MDIKKVLIIEDVQEIANIIEINVKDLGLNSVHISDGEMGLKTALSEKFCLIILDLMLPKLDGITICSKIREVDPVTPILILTAKGDEFDRVLGLEFGADDYMTKPFSVRELTARIKALLRRSNLDVNSSNTQAENKITIGTLIMDINKRKVLLNKKEIELTVKEFELLALFMQNPGKAYSRADLLVKIWGYQFEGYEHTVNTHINRLRNKIEFDPSQPQLLKTVWGIGYRFVE